MTLPVLGVIGLTFLCIILVGGIAFLVLFVNRDLRSRLCEILASYRGPPKEGKIDKHHRKKRHKNSEEFEDMFTSRVPSPPIHSMYGVSHNQLHEHKQGYTPGNYHQQQNMHNHGNPYVSAQQIPRQSYRHSNPDIPYVAANQVTRQPYNHSNTGNPYVATQQMPRQSHNSKHAKPHHASNPQIHSNTKSAGKKKRTGSGEYLMYPNSSGTSSPHDSGLGTMEGKSIHGILKHTNSNGHPRGKDNNGHVRNTKSVGYEDQIQTIEIS